jgi:CheY-like chemotaxis protein
MSGCGVALPERVRVVIVDDMTDVRALVRRLFERDDRFEVVAEGADGLEAIELAARLQPDLLVLDQQMPRLGGVEATPRIRAASPATAVVLFTARTDAGIHQAALSAGALDVIEKNIGPGLVDQLARTLVDHWASPDAELQMSIGPVASEAASAWIANTRLIVNAVRRRPDVLVPPPPADVLDDFSDLLDVWDEVTRSSDNFFWAARAAAVDVHRLVDWWARIDGMSDEQLRTLGVGWSPPAGEPFFLALAAGVLAALNAHPSTQDMARDLRRQWEPAGASSAEGPQAGGAPPGG